MQRCRILTSVRAGATRMTWRSRDERHLSRYGVSVAMRPHGSHERDVWYVAKFDEASWQLAAALGLTAARFKRECIGLAAVDQHIVYKRELHAGDVVSIRSTVLDVTEKSVRIVHQMSKDDTDEIAAITTLVAVHLDTTGRKARALPSDVREHAMRMIAEREGDADDDTLRLALDDVAGSKSGHPR
jgi:acyl-CoA thioester hydrolase